MLQFITHQSDRFSIPEEAQMAIEGGCRWIQLRMKDASDEEVKAVANEIIPLCKENDTFLIIDDRVELVNELRVSGVHLGKEDMDPLQARELLGPHAIIGVTANTADDILRFKGKDVDYVGLGPVHFTTTKAKLSPELGIEGVKRVIDEVRTKGVELPIV
ncbi:MAG: thiamine phosphate synthase, partial [Paramuribaculum sp.]|nr:thiamine phosphate synthase [Paramuribaculum sp.]